MERVNLSGNTCRISECNTYEVTGGAHACIIATPSRYMYAMYHLFSVPGDQHLQKEGCKSVGGQET